MTRTVAESLARLALEEVPRRLDNGTRERLKLHLFDTLVALLAAAEIPEASAVARMGAAWGHGGGVSDSARSADDWPPGLLTLLGATLIRGTEVDDIHLESCTTPGSTAVPPALALVSRYDAEIDPETFLEALAGGYEVLARFGTAVSGPYVVYGGKWPTLWGAPLAAAAVTARLRNLTVEQTAHGLTIAAASTTPVSGHRGGAHVPSRAVRLGMAAWLGLSAAMAAEAGFEADVAGFENLLERSAAGAPIDAEVLVDGRDSLAIDETSIKLFPCSRQAMSAVHGMITELSRQRLTFEAVETIRIEVPVEYYAMVSATAYPSTRLAALTNVRYLVALAVLDPSRFHSGGPLLVEDERVQALMQRVEVAASEELSALYPRAWPCTVIVRSARGNGRLTVHAVPGDPASPVSWDEVLRKARSWTRVPADELQALADRCRSLDTDGGWGDFVHWCRDTLPRALSAVVGEEHSGFA